MLTSHGNSHSLPYTDGNHGRGFKSFKTCRKIFKRPFVAGFVKNHHAGGIQRTFKLSAENERIYGVCSSFGSCKLSLAISAIDRSL